MPGETPSESGSLDDAVAAVRRFSRFYTRRIGVLEEKLLGGPVSLAEGRLVWELAQDPDQTAARLAETLALDPGYLSRLLRALEERGLLARRPSPRDAREALLSLTRAGRAAYATINRRSQRDVGAMLAGLSDLERERLVASLAAVERLLGGGEESRVPYLLRPPRAGDLGLVVSRQASLYASEYGWNREFEALLAEIVAGFIRNFDAGHERCWIAEREGEIAGSVFVVRQSVEVAKLRMLYVEPQARGLGIGGRLVEECIAFAREAGYRRMTLWTNDVLTAARWIYERAGFRLVQSERHHSFGHDLVGENWERAL